MIFQYGAKIPENIKVRPEWLIGLPWGRGYFGFTKEQRFTPIVIGNSCGGMNEATYALCVEQMLIPSYPDIETGEKTVCLVDDGGPGRNNNRNQRDCDEEGGCG